MAKFADVKKGLYDTQYEISGKPPTQDNNTTEEPRQAISLIDLDDTPAISSSTGSTSPNNNGSSMSALNELSDIFGSNNISSPSVSSSQQTGQSNFDLFNSPSSQKQQQQQQQPKKSNDIFDLLGGGIPNHPSPLISNSEIASPSISNINAPQARQHTPTPVFDSNQETNVKSGKYIYSYCNNNVSSTCLYLNNIIAILVNKNGLQIELQMKNPQDSLCQIKAYFSNQSTAPMEKLMLRLAAPKV